MKFANASKLHRKSGVRWGRTWGTRPGDEACGWTTKVARIPPKITGAQASLDKRVSVRRTTLAFETWPSFWFSQLVFRLSRFISLFMMEVLHALPDPGSVDPSVAGQGRDLF
jgi:hypothetical protein